jgi:hypothetical protein
MATKRYNDNGNNNNGGGNLVACAYFSWRLFRRDGVWYADGRRNEPNLGKHTLESRDRTEALRNLHELDRAMAVRLKLAEPDDGDGRHEAPAIDAGWERYLAHAGRPDVLGGVGPRTLKRYRAVRDKHVPFCAARGVRRWDRVDKQHLQGYCTDLGKRGYSDSAIYLEGTLLKQVVKWMVLEEKVCRRRSGST